MNEFYWLILFFLLGINPVFAQEFYQAHTRVKLVSEQDAVVAGSTFWVAIDMALDDGWHVYWQNPGDSGLTPKIKWTVPSGVKAGQVQWPYPQRIVLGPLTSYGYEHEAILLVPITVDESLKSSSNVNIHAHVDWLACFDMCMPGRAELN